MYRRKVLSENLNVFAMSDIKTFCRLTDTTEDGLLRQSLRLTIDPYTLSTKNAIRVTLTKRATLIVHAGDAYNFVKGVISTAKTALTAA